MTRDRSRAFARRGKSGLAAAMLAAGALAFAPTVAQAQIANSATAGGSYNGAPVISNTATAEVPVSPPNQVLAVSVAPAAFDTAVAGDGDLEPGDTVAFVVSVRNDGNVTMTNVAPVLDALTFNGAPHDPARLTGPGESAATLVPGAARDFTFTYALSAADIYGAAGVSDGVAGRFTATGSGPAPETRAEAASAVATMEADPELSIVKSFVFASDSGVAGSADVGDVVTYSYVVTNTGNVALSNVFVKDTHEAGEAHEAIFDSSAYTGTPGTGPGQWNVAETAPAAFGANADENAADAVFGTLGVGGALTFTYTHAVTQAEFDAQ